MYKNTKTMPKYEAIEEVIHNNYLFLAVSNKIVE